MPDPTLREELLRLYERDRRTRQALVDRGELWDGYHPEMETVHRENAHALTEVIETSGWPLASRVGEDGAEAAFVIATHTIGEPAFQRRCLELLRAAVEKREAPAAKLATLVDRVRFNARRPQIYGTIFDWDEDGELSPWRIEDPANVETCRAEVGLSPLHEKTREAREHARREPARPPQAFAARQATLLAWSRRVGWVED